MIDIAIAEQICNAIAITPKSLDAICEENPNFPHRATFKRWLHQSDEVRAMYARAKVSQCQLLAEQILTIADESQSDTYKDEDGVELVNHDVIDRAKVRIDARKWLCAKLAPRIFGDRVQQEHSGPDGGPLQFVTRSILDAKE
jgi:hypothetical protein